MFCIVQIHLSMLTCLAAPTAAWLVHRLADTPPSITRSHSRPFLPIAVPHGAYSAGSDIMSSAMFSPFANSFRQDSGVSTLQEWCSYLVEVDH
jgi:hypothetical protein